MNLKRIFTFLTVLIFLLVIFIQIEFAPMDPNSPILWGDNSAKLLDILSVAFRSIIVSAILTAYIYITFKLLDNGRWYIELLGVIISGVIGSVILLVTRWIYHKIGFHFLS